MTEHQEEQAALHALHMLDPHESRILESEMRSDSRLLECVAELEESAAKISFLLPEQTPPPECRRELLTALKQRRRANMAAISTPLRIFRNPWLAWAAAAGLAIAAVGLWNASQSLSSKIVSLGESETSAKSEAAKAREINDTFSSSLIEADHELAHVKSELRAKITRLNEAGQVARMEAVVLRSAIKRYDEGVAIVIWDSEKQEGKLKLDKLPPAPSNKDYQLWVLDKKTPGSPISAGVIKVDQRGFATVTFKPTGEISEMSKFALSLEKQGGVSQKSQDGPIVFIGP